MKLKAVATFNNESVNKTAYLDFINYLDTSNITRGTISAVVRMNIKDAPSRAKRLVRKNDIVYSTVRPNLEHYGIIEYPKDNMVVSTGFVVIRVNPELADPHFVYLAITQPNITKHLHSIAETTTSAYPSIRPEVLEELEIDLPPMAKQKGIARFIKRIDDKIASNTHTNDNLHNIVEAMFRETYNTGSPETLGSLLHSVESGSRPKGGAATSGIPSIGAEKIENFGYYDFSSEKFIDHGYYQKLKRGKLKDGDLLLYKDGAYTGKSSLALDGFPHSEAAVNEHVFILNTKNNFAQFFLYFCVHIDENRDKLHTLAAGKAAQPGLNQSELGSINILLPGEEKIKAFEKSVSPLMHQIAQNAKENRRLATLRDTLLPELMNGKIDLSKVEI